MASTPTSETSQINHESDKQLYRSETDRMLAGICGGIAEYFGWDAAIVRLTFIFIILLGGSGILAYILLWVIVPTQSDVSKERTLKGGTQPLVKQTLPKKSLSTTSAKHPGWGIFLIGVGAVLLLHNLGIGQYLQLDRTWPILLVILGFIVLGK